MSGEVSFLNLFRDSRTPLDSIRDKLLTLLNFVIVQSKCRVKVDAYEILISNTDVSYLL